MVDDLVTRGTLEPYRMFTSRAEYRLLLREDNADLRLDRNRTRDWVWWMTARWAAFSAKRETLERERQRLQNLWLRPADLSQTESEQLLGAELNREVRVLHLLARPNVSYRKLMQLPQLGPGATDPQVIEQLEVQAKYAGYIERQQDEIERQRANEAVVLPLDFDYAKVRGLSSEVQEKFLRHRPATLGQAGRIPGVTPAAISLLLIHLKKRSA